VVMEIQSAPQPFAAVWPLVSEVPGWLTEDQARMLWDAVLQLRSHDIVVEIGSHQGRSTAVLASAARHVGARVVAIDPFVEGRMFGGVTTRDRFRDTIARLDLGDVVELVQDYSTRRRPTWSQRVALLYVDGKHDYWTASDDLRWSAFMPLNANVLVHDAFSSVGVTLAFLRRVLVGSTFAYVERKGSMARLVVRRPQTADRVRFIRQLPWFARNVVIKLLLRLRLRPAARLLGHASPVDPY
jgi:hypothetical protein